MTQQRHQHGYVHRRHNSWYIVYYERETVDGESRSLRREERLCSLDEAPTKNDARLAADDFMREVNAGRVTAHTRMTLGEFYRGHYLPYIEEELEPSTVYELENIWRRYVEKTVSHIRLRDFQTHTGSQLIKRLWQEHDLSRASLYRVKNFLSALFKYARNEGALYAQNPMRDVIVPKKARGKGETHAYSLAEIELLLRNMPDIAGAAIALGGYAGLSRSELRGLKWSDFDEGMRELTIARKIWEGHEGPPKTQSRAATIPVIEPLRRRLLGLRGDKRAGYVFESKSHTSLDMMNLLNRVILPILYNIERDKLGRIVRKTPMLGIEWRGWHALRRGLASNLHQLGVDDKTIQRVLRHADVATTQRHYIITQEPEVTEAMERLEKSVGRGRVN
jgi:integrase